MSATQRPGTNCIKSFSSSSALRRFDRRVEFGGGTFTQAHLHSLSPKHNLSGYPGSKGQDGVWQRIIGQMPPHSTYCEPFFGSGEIFWHKRRAASSILIDRLPPARLPGLAKAQSDAGASVITGDAIGILPALDLPADAVVYCDPPYVLSTRQGRLYYGDNELSDQDHQALLFVLDQLPCRILLSGYPSKLYGDFFCFKPAWRRIDYRTRTRGKTLTECLWCNFPEPIDLHDWRYAGQTYRQRLTFKRLARRWLKKLAAMPERKRGYVLDAIENHYVPGRSASSGVGGPACQVLCRIIEHRNGGESAYVAKAFLGKIPIFTSQPGALPLHAMYEAQDWAIRQGKVLRFDQDFV